MYTFKFLVKKNNMVSGSQLLKFVYFSYWKKGAQHLENEF